jgi:radical SAM superfamily enzyme YgiQ (UPF0313 family)
MSRVLFLQLMRACSPGDTDVVFDQALGQLSTILRAKGHSTALARIVEFDAHRLRELMHRTRPDVVYAMHGGTSTDLATRVLLELRECYRCTVVVGGPTVTVLPDLALSLPGVAAAFLGEPDHAFPVYLGALAAGNGQPDIEGVWTSDGSRVRRNGHAVVVADLDELPFADRELFGAGPSTDVFDISVGRGCPSRCAYCPNDRIRDATEAGGAYVRRRSADHICDELDELCQRYPETRMIRITDHALLHDVEWLEEFAATYADRCGMPFSCHVRANMLDEHRADLLRYAGCVSAEIEVISGSDFIRNEILDMETTDEDLEAAFRLLHARDIDTCAVNFVGAPYATQSAELRTVELNRALRPSLVEVRVFYPYAGTAARDLCREMGWLSNRSEHGYTMGNSVLDMPALTPGRIRELSARMEADISGRSAWWRRMSRYHPASILRRLAESVAALTRAPRRLIGLMRRS